MPEPYGIRTAPGSVCEKRPRLGERVGGVGELGHHRPGRGGENDGRLRSGSSPWWWVGTVRSRLTWGRLRRPGGGGSAHHRGCHTTGCPRRGGSVPCAGRSRR